MLLIGWIQEKSVSSSLSLGCVACAEHLLRSADGTYGMVVPPYHK